MDAMVIQWEHVALIVLLGAVAVALAKLWYRKDTEQEKRLKAYAEIAGWLDEVKLPNGAEIFRCLGAKDISGCIKAVQHLIMLLRDRTNRLRLLDENFAYQLTERLKDVAQRAEIVKQVQATVDAASREKQRTYEALVMDPSVADVEEIAPPQDMIS